MKKAFRIALATVLMILALGFLAIGPLYYVPVKVEVPVESSTVEEEVEETPEVKTYVTKWAGEVFFEKIGMEKLSNSKWAPLGTSLDSMVSVALMAISIYIYTHTLKKKAEAQKVKAVNPIQTQPVIVNIDKATEKKEKDKLDF